MYKEIKEPQWLQKIPQDFQLDYIHDRISDNLLEKLKNNYDATSIDILSEEEKYYLIGDKDSNPAIFLVEQCLQLDIKPFPASLLTEIILKRASMGHVGFTWLEDDINDNEKYAIGIIKNYNQIIAPAYHDKDYTHPVSREVLYSIFDKEPELLTIEFNNSSDKNNEVTRTLLGYVIDDDNGLFFQTSFLYLSLDIPILECSAFVAGLTLDEYIEELIILVEQKEECFPYDGLIEESKVELTKKLEGIRSEVHKENIEENIHTIQPESNRKRRPAL